MLGQYKSHNIPNSYLKKNFRTTISFNVNVKGLNAPIRDKVEKCIQNGILHSANYKSKYRLKVRVGIH